MHSGVRHFPRKWLRNRSARPDGSKHQQNAGSPSSQSTKIHLDGQARLLLTVQGLCTAANALSGTFVNVYLWKARQDFLVIGWFTLVHHIAMALTFWLAGKWVKEHNKMNCLRTGVAVSAAFYILVLWFGPRAADYYLLLGAIQGMATGFFWVSFNVVYFEVTNPATRDRFNGWAGLLGSAAGMIAPWISGFLIVHMMPTIGYRVIFTISLVVFLIGVVVSFFLKKRKTVGHYDWLLPWRCLRQKNPGWRTVTAALAAQGIREGVFGFMIALLVYVHTGSEMSLGNFSLVTSAVALFSFLLIGHFLKPRHRRTSMLIGAVMIIVVLLPFFWQVNFTTLLIFGVGVGLFYPLFSIPMTSSVFDLIGRHEDSVKRREEYIVLRELALNVGRIVGTAAFIMVVSLTSAPLVMNLLLLVIGSSPLLAWFFMRRVHLHAGGDDREHSRARVKQPTIT
ncbi:MFS transporter [Paenibacillus xerothermodurans]|uniref:MFS transporter n=1 Tax=Paenibacillus xerothermodurans TaxID=1977292 RepID=A0A2W1N710_PAEXE|nr:MFS transporter [Paenibacillus xerothermodurans]PZE20389.1 MFS transporter [Paenibacillus xerothermodurans]